MLHRFDVYIDIREIKFEILMSVYIILFQIILSTIQTFVTYIH